jgi:O-antigen/teichoic acid export membrane protein
MNALPTAQPVQSPPGAAEEIRPGQRALFRRRLADWTKILSAYFTAQTVTQLLSIASGLLFVNFMPVREFALYTLAFSAITFFNFASDLGSTTSLLHFFHRTAREGEDFQPYYAAVLSLRRGAFLLGAAGVAAAFPLMAVKKGFGGWDVTLTTVGILLCVWFQIRVSLRVLALRLRSGFGRSYRAEISGSGLRLGFAALMVLTSRLQAWLGVVVTALGSGLTALLARPTAASRLAPVPAGSLGPYRRKILRYLLPTLPAALYFSVQGPLIIWLSATFGSARNIAEVGALGRLGLVVGLFSSLTGTVFLPRLAHVVDDRLYRRRFLQFGSLLAAAAASLTLVAAVAPALFLFLLGPKYRGLGSELLLLVAGSGVNLLDGYTVNVNLARSWTRWQGVALAVQVSAQALLVVLLPMSSTFNVLRFNLLSGCIALGLQLLTACAGFMRPRWVYWS